MNIIFKRNDQGQGYFDLDFNNLTQEYNLVDSVWLSLFCWSRATEQEQIKHGVEPYGWWMESFGSKLWKLQRAIINDDTVDETKSDIESALAWLIKVGVAREVIVNCWSEGNKLFGTIEIIKSDEKKLNLTLDELFKSFVQ